jgi:hypothetical protein
MPTLNLGRVVGPEGPEGPEGPAAVVTETNVAAAINGTSAKTTPVDADEMPIMDSAASAAIKRLTFANLWVWILAKINEASLAFTSTTRPTSAGTGTPASNSLITREDADSRGGRMVICLLSADETGTENSTTMKTSAVTVPLGVGTWYFELDALVDAGAAYATAGAKSGVTFSGTATFEGHLFYSQSTAAIAGGPSSTPNAADFMIEMQYSSRSIMVRRVGKAVVTVAGNMAITFANCAAVSGNAPTLSKESKIIARRIA